MNKYLELLLGVVFLVIGIWGIYWFSGNVIDLIKGSWGIFVALLGLLFLMLGISDLKE